MAPLRSFEVNRRIAVSIDLDRMAARAWTKSFAPYFGVVAAVAPSLCMCLRGYCSPFNTFGRAFEFVARCTSRLSLSNTVERARSAAISPNSWWKKLSVDTELSLVGRGQADSSSFGTLLCAFYLRKSRSVSWPLFSFSLPSIFESLWDVWASPSYFRCGWRPWAEIFFPGSFERIPTASTAPWTPLHVRSTAPWTRTRTSEKATFLLPVCTRNTYSALVGLFSIKTGCCLKKRAGHGRWRERNERKQLDLHVHTRGESKDSSTTWLWQSVSAVPQHCLTTPLSHRVANVKRRQLLWKTRENRHKWFCPTLASPSSRSRCHTGNRLGA